MPSARSATALVIAASIALFGCEHAPKIAKPSKAFCDAGKKYETEITAKKQPAVTEQVQLVEKMAANAPPDIKNDAETFLDAMRKLEAGDSSVKNSAAVKKAVNNVNRHYAQGCGLYARQGPL